MSETIVAAVKSSSYDQIQVAAAVRKAIELAGGLPTSVKPGARVLVKPNFLTAKAPSEAATTHPEVVRALIRELRRAGAGEIVVGDSPAGKYSWEELWDKTGFADMAAEEGVELLPFDEFERRDVGGEKDVPFVKGFLDFDVFISVPKLKTHLLTKFTGAVKNSYGLIVGGAKSNYHGHFPSPRKMAGFIVQVYGVRPPDFVLMDGIECMEGDGPSGGKARVVGVVLASRDGVALDACACEAYGYRGEQIDTLVKAAAANLGVLDPVRVGDGWEALGKVKAKRSVADMLHLLPERLFRVITLFVSCRPHIDHALCVKCLKCVKICSQRAIAPGRGGRLQVKGSKCVLCMCCIEACPCKAIELRSPGISMMSQFRGLLRKFGRG